MPAFLLVEDVLKSPGGSDPTTSGLYIFILLSSAQ